MIDDEYETPNELFYSICERYNIIPDLDVAANKNNTKCKRFLTDGLNRRWIAAAVWCNPPHSMTKEFVIKAWNEWKDHGTPIIMLIPANSVCTKYAEKYIRGSAQINPIYGRPIFLKNGKPSKHPSRNSYFTVFYPPIEYGITANKNWLDKYKLFK